MPLKSGEKKDVKNLIQTCKWGGQNVRMNERIEKNVNYLKNIQHQMYNIGIKKKHNV